MDPIFASLLDRAMTERGIPANGRTNPWNKPKVRPALIKILRATYRGVRKRFARFKNLGDVQGGDKAGHRNAGILLSVAV